jgi:very-short-patch-repair endonuclease
MAMQSSSPGATEATRAVSISITCDRAINYAFQQNSIPILRELRITNGSPDELRDIVIRISAEPAFAIARELHAHALPPGEEFRLAPVELKLSPDYLASLTERVTGLLHVEVVAAERSVCRHSESIALLARNEWCGLVSLPEILAAFVLPNDPIVMRVLSSAAQILQKHTGRSALNGYQDKSRERAWQQVSAIYQALAAERIRYISPPASFEETGQKVRFPTEVIGQQFGTCLDLALLFAACCEQAGLHPLILMHHGHAYAGCWIVERTLTDPASDDQQAIRKLVELEELTVIETTALTSESPPGLKQAELLAAPHLRAEAQLRLALDIKRARSARIHPLPIPGQPHHPPTSDPATNGHNGDLGSRDFPAQLIIPAQAPKPVTRIDQWKSRLLDLTLRNRLLNFRATKGTVQILSAAPEHVEDQLSASVELRLVPRPTVMAGEDPRNAGVYSRQQRADALLEHLQEELRHGRLHTALEEGEHQRRLTELYRAARLALDENGTNTLYAAVGVLEWRETEHSDRTLRAPLLLVPVELKRKSVLEGFQLRRIDEEARLNVTLMEMLRQHFRKEIAGLEPLPEDETGVDVAQVFRIFRAAVRDLPGWEVKSEIWLGQFSFTKFLLWKDLADRLDDLTRNRVVRHMVHEAGLPYPNPAEDIQPGELDDRFTPSEIYCPRSADSSQLAAVIAAANGQDFVLEGPPGTGKSQTITNIIAHCLAHGRRVLFVAEKRAALDVVHRRLKEEGLSPFCLELHSNKTGKGEVLGQFKETLDFAAQQSPQDWLHRADELKCVRDELNAYVRALHHRYPCGLSAHLCFDFLVPRRELAVVKLAWPDILACDAERLDRCRDAARQLAQRAELLGDIGGHPLGAVQATEWSPQWADDTREHLAALGARAAAVTSRAGELRLWLGRPSSPANLGELLVLRDLAAQLLNAQPVGASFATTPWQQLASDLHLWIALVKERGQLRDQLTGFDEGRLLALDLAGLKHRWQSAQTAWFLVKWIRISGVRGQLRTARPDAKKTPVEALPTTLDHALRLQEINAKLRGAAPVASATLGQLWNKGEPSVEALEKARAWGESLHAALVALALDDSDCLQSLRQRLAALFAEGPTSFAVGTVNGGRLGNFAGAWDAFAQALDAVSSATLLNRVEIDRSPDFIGAAARLVERIAAAWRHIRPWCSWQKGRAVARDLGLGPLCEAIDAGTAPAAAAPDWFERSFRRALLDAILGSNDVLRGFFGHEHRERIERFRRLDEQVTKLTRELIRARLAAGIPRDQLEETVPKTELSLLRKEIGKKARHLPVRQLLSRIPALAPRLKPCVLMSPLSVAQYLDASHEQFDLVVFDEASQIPVWDAIGAIARGKQLIVVGDPKQLPPTNFFNRSEESGEDEVLGECEDLESILDELLSHGLRHKRLQWHYRSRHEGLIAFSNHNYYANDLLTFPSPDVGHTGVRYQLVDSSYDKGRTRTNRGEAEALVAELIRRLRDPEQARRSYGVVTFSQAQQLLVENLLDEQRRKHPEIETHFGDTPPNEGEPVFVKNLENVQGDERDVILFSIGYGPDETGRVSMNFGPLNRDGGERRLNVAITRAKQEVLVFTCLRPEQIDLARTRARGVRDLKLFLEYAERGPRALAAADTTPNGETRDSEFERMVANRLRELGHEVHLQVGCSGYRIDLAVVDSAAPGRYLLAVECDGATYHRAATARDRDKLRQLVLEGLGWKLHRIWSTDWWHDAEGEMEKLTAALAGAARRN